MKLHIYTRDDSGYMSYKGEREWDSVEQCVSWYCQDDATPEQAELAGWPTSTVTWYGNLGISHAD